MLRGFSNIVIFKNGLVQGVKQVRCPHDIPSIRWDFCYPSAKDFVQNLQLSQSRRQLVHYYGKSYCRICKYQEIKLISQEKYAFKCVQPLWKGRANRGCWVFILYRKGFIFLKKVLPKGEEKKAEKLMYKGTDRKRNTSDSSYRKILNFTCNKRIKIKTTLWEKNPRLQWATISVRGWWGD